MADLWHCARGETRLGPFNWDQVSQLFSAGLILPTDLLRRDDWAEWVKAGDVCNLTTDSHGVGRIPAPEAEREKRAAEELYNHGKTYFECGDWDVAIANLDCALVLDPQMQQARDLRDLAVRRKAERQAQSAAGAKSGTLPADRSATGTPPVEIKLRPYRLDNFWWVGVSLLAALFFGCIAWWNDRGLVVIGVTLTPALATFTYSALAFLCLAWVVWFGWRAIWLIVIDAKVVFHASGLHVTEPTSPTGVRVIPYSLIAGARECSSEHFEDCYIEVTLSSGEPIRFARMWFASDTSYQLLMSNLVGRMNSRSSLAADDSAALVTPASVSAPRQIPEPPATVPAYRTAPTQETRQTPTPAFDVKNVIPPVKVAILPIIYGAGLCSLAGNYLPPKSTGIFFLIVLIGATGGATVAWIQAMNQSRRHTTWEAVPRSERLGLLFRLAGFGLAWVAAVVVPTGCVALYGNRADVFQEYQEFVKHVKQAREYAENGKDDKAIEEFTKAFSLIAIHPNPKEEELRTAFARVLTERGLLYAAKTEWDKAIADFDAALRYDAKLAEAYLWRGEAHRAKGNVVGAQADFKEAIRLKPDLAKAKRKP